MLCGNGGTLGEGSIYYDTGENRKDIGWDKHREGRNDGLEAERISALRMLSTSGCWNFRTMARPRSHFKSITDPYTSKASLSLIECIMPRHERDYGGAVEAL